MKASFLAAAARAVYIAAMSMALLHGQSTNPNPDPNNVNPACGLTITGPSWIPVNDDDDNENERWDWDEEPVTRLPDVLTEPPLEDDTAKIIVTLTVPETCTPANSAGVVSARVYLTEASLNQIHGFYPGKLIVKDKDGNTVREEGDDRLAQEKRVTKQVPYFISVVPGQTATLHLYIEGYHHSATAVPEIIMAEISSGSGCTQHTIAPAKLELAVYQADLDVDSNNNEGTSFTGEGSREEDEIESSLFPTSRYPAPNWSKRPGKLIMANDGFGDDIPDWADGFNSSDATTQDSSCGPPITFIPVLLERKPPFTDACTVKFTYSASDPRLVPDPVPNPLLTPTSGKGFPGFDWQFTKPTGKFIRVWKKNNDGSERNEYSVVYSGDYVPDGVDVPWIKLSSGAVAQLWVEAVEPSGSLGDIVVSAKVSEGVATGTEPPPNFTDVIRMTALKITCEPITAEPQSGLYLYNPAGVVALEDAFFKIDVEPQEFPDAEIEWKTEMWAGLSPLPRVGTTRMVKFRHGASWNTGSIRAEVKGNYYPHPMFPVKVFANWSEIHLNVFVVPSDGSYSTTQGDPAVSDADLAAIVSRLNEVHRQAGMRYTYSRTLLPQTDSGYFECDATEQWNLVDKPRNGISGLEVYFVGGSPNWNGVDMRPARPFATSHGIIINSVLSQLSPSQLGRNLAHEIGHTCTLDDIYSSKSDPNNIAIPYMELAPYAAKHAWSSSDWPSEAAFACDPSYYKRLLKGYETATTSRVIGHDTSGNPIYAPDLEAYATRQQMSLIRRLMMYGSYVGPTDPLGTGLDIPLGRVYGIEGGYGTTFPLNEAHVVVGLSDMDRFPTHQ